jgi:hypothetical protein
MGDNDGREKIIPLPGRERVGERVLKKAPFADLGTNNAVKIAENDDG